MKVKEVLAIFKRVFVKRKYKDILFRFVFREKEEILQLYNAMNQTNYTNPNDLVITTMEDVIYIGMNRYQKKLIKLPFPRFVVFYNGEDDIEEDLYMRLSDVFEVKDENDKPAVECIAKRSIGRRWQICF